MKAEDVKTKLSARLSSKPGIGRFENVAFVRDFPQKVTVEDVKNEAFARDFPQSLKVEDVEAKLSYETSFKA